MTKWYRRLAEVPGVQYQGSPDVIRSRLPEHKSVPEISTFNFDGKQHDSIMWTTPEGSTSASPAHRWQTQPQPNETKGQTALRQLHETLELPGILSDYHFAIQNCHQTLWKQRREEPWILSEVERLCWLDIHLVEAQPTIAFWEREDTTHSISILAFGQLVRLYEREGNLYEALAVAQRAEHFQQGKYHLENLQPRIAQLELEAEA
ncbi:MAG: hypothetical protein J0L70_30160 [Leptolyngbya sp. UWPOB_LEPTO1]|uniref:hypothetical protein n=1 Tax=Leptolyngbya sp. UWPOB_LEPTO1 TaxID=2815653 RepID=UPI001ACBFFE6|nr:hypothetical protein [Leptolyngbya sp. UWPOB_LEPTO1]MBN8564799.1 hypothetical protein [Leptolyngbya sp. UWPOB_LEPTO1]